MKDNMKKYTVQKVSIREMQTTKTTVVQHGGKCRLLLTYEFGNNRPLYILSNNCLAPGLLRSPLLFGRPVPKHTGQTSFPLPASKHDCLNP